MFFPFKDSVKTGGWILLLLSIIGIIAVVLGLFSSHDMLFQSVAVLLSVMVTAIVTGALLERQTIGEEQRERNLKIYENKIAVYSQFISKMWGMLSDNEPVSAEQMMSLRKEVFNQLIFYADETLISKVLAEIELLSKLNAKVEAEKKNNSTYREKFANITAILQHDIVSTPKGNYAKTVSALWSAFGSSDEEAPAGPASPAEISGITQSKSIDEVNREAEQRIEGYDCSCVHFCVFDGEYQTKLWTDPTKTDNLYPLFLCEYGESWRTNFIKYRIKPDDVVFLFQRGGNGYAGVFRTKKYVVFEKVEVDENTKEICCEIHDYSPNEPQRIGKDDPRFNKLIEAYQASELQDEDNATYYSYLLAEPIVLYKDLNCGVGSISTYRRTISTYDPHYAWMTAARFLHQVDNGDTDITVNQSLLDTLVKKYRIVSAQQDEDGNWKE